MSEAGTLKFICITCKAVQKQAGCHLLFKSYLESQCVKLFHIAKFQGNRFNIIFYKLQCSWNLLPSRTPYTVLGRGTPKSKPAARSSSERCQNPSLSDWVPGPRTCEFSASLDLCGGCWSLFTR